MGKNKSKNTEDTGDIGKECFVGGKSPSDSFDARNKQGKGLTEALW
jgi:hypothetical protein